MSGPRDPGPGHDRLAAAARHLPLPSVPTELGRQLRQTFHISLPLLAELEIDTRDELSLVGVRGRSATAWTMTYRAGDGDVVLDLVPTSDRVRVRGHLLHPAASPDAPVRVFRADDLVAATQTDRFGQFDLGELPTEVHTVTVSVGSRVVELVVDLRERTSP